MDNLRRAFLLITVIVLIGAAVVGFMLALNAFIHKDIDSVVDLLPEGEKYDPDSSGSPETPAPEGDASRHTALFIALGDKSRSPELVFSVSADYDALTLDLIFYPVDTFVSLKKSDGTSDFNSLSGYYLDEGPDKMKDACDGILGIPSENVIAFPFESLSKLINCFTSRDSGILYNVPCGITSDGYSAQSFTLKAGLSHFVGNNSRNLLTFYKNGNGVYDSETVKFYDGTRTPQNLVAATFFKALIEQKLTGTPDAYYTANYLSYFDDFLASCTGSFERDIVKRFKGSCASFKPVDIRVYVIDTVATGASADNVYSGSIEMVENVDGVISRKKIEGSELSELTARLY